MGGQNSENPWLPGPGFWKPTSQQPPGVQLQQLLNPPGPSQSMLGSGVAEQSQLMDVAMDPRLSPYPKATPEQRQAAQQQLNRDMLHTVMATGGADITADVPGGISGRAHLGMNENDPADHYRHYPVLDEQGKHVGYLDAHLAHDPDTGKKLIHVDMLSVGGGHNLLPVFHQMKDLWPESEGVLAQRISGLGNTSGRELKYFWPRVMKGAGEPSAAATGTKELAGAAQVAGAKEELARTAAGAPTGPGAPAYPPAEANAISEATQADLGRSMSDIMMRPPARGDPRGPLPLTSRTTQYSGSPYGPRDPTLTSGQRLASTAGPRPNLPHWQQWVSSAPDRPPGQTYRQWLETRFPQEMGLPPPAPGVDLGGGPRQFPSDVTTDRPLSAHEDPPPYMRDFLHAQASGHTGDDTYVDWLRANHPDIAARRYGDPDPSEASARAQQPTRDWSPEGRTMRLGGTPQPEPYRSTPETRAQTLREIHGLPPSTYNPGEGYLSWLRRNYPGYPGNAQLQAEYQALRSDSLHQPGAVSGVGPPRPELTGATDDPTEVLRRAQQHAEQLPHYGEYRQDPTYMNTAYSDWLFQRYPDEARQRYGSVASTPAAVRFPQPNR